MSLLKLYRGPLLQQLLNEITAPVRVNYQVADRPEADVLDALEDLKAMTPYLVTIVEEYYMAEADRVTVYDVEGRGLVFVGAPVGTELASLVSAIVVAGRGYSGLSIRTRQLLNDLQQSVHLEVFTSPT